MRFIEKLFHRTLNNVLFGVGLMVLIAAYVAIGSGYNPVREHFEMNELQFFSAWPLKLLTALLICNLTFVTFSRIPFTPPRYGVWLIHAGIITLVCGMSWYYTLKEEGRVLIPKGQSRVNYYDSAERALFARVGQSQAQPIPLEKLPRYHAYAERHGNAGYLDRDAFKGLVPQVSVGGDEKRSIFQALGLPDGKIDIVAYYPYANIDSDYREDPAGTPAIKLTPAHPANEPAAQGEEHDHDHGESFLVSNDPMQRVTAIGTTELEQRHVAGAAEVKEIADAAGKLHRLQITLAGKTSELFVEVGKTYPLEGGYALAVTSFNPQFPTSDRKEVLPAMTFAVTAPTQKFNRMVLSGKPLQTDFQLNVEGAGGAGPMGKRQKEPLDNNLVIVYDLSDPFRLLPRQMQEKQTLLTSGDQGLTAITTGYARASEVKTFDAATGEILVSNEPPRGPFQPPPPQTVKPAEPIAVKFQRRTVTRVDSAVEVPREKWQRDEAGEGLRQVIEVRITSGDFSRNVFVPFAKYAADPMTPWTGEAVLLPGAVAPLRLQLSNTLRPMPARVKLDEFKLVPYAGGDDSPRSIMRDFQSDITISDPNTGQEKLRGTAKMNSPVYFSEKMSPMLPAMSWLFFQAEWDPAGQRWTVLGVGNRPGIYIMVAGSIMIFAGLMYAFYAKPIIIRQMKERAIREAEARGKLKKPKPEQREVVASSF